MTYHLAYFVNSTHFDLNIFNQFIFNSFYFDRSNLVQLDFSILLVLLFTYFNLRGALSFFRHNTCIGL